MDSLKEVATGLRARMLWLYVGEQNSAAIQFYLKYGFQKTKEVRKGVSDNHSILVLLLNSDPSSSSPSSAVRSSSTSKSKSKKKGKAKSGKGFGVSACLTGSKPLIFLSPGSANASCRNAHVAFSQGSYCSLRPAAYPHAASFRRGGCLQTHASVNANISRDLCRASTAVAPGCKAVQGCRISNSRHFIQSVCPRPQGGPALMKHRLSAPHM